MARVVQRNTDGADIEYLKRIADEYQKSKELQSSIEKRTNGLKKELSDAVEQFGTADFSGHVWLDLDGVKVKRERRVSRSLDIEAAQEWAVNNGHWDEVKEVIEVLSEDKLLGLAWGNKDLEETIQGFYKEKEIWALKV